MEINALSTPMPALPEASREPPRNAEIVTAVRESEGAEGGKNDTRSNDNEQAEARSSVSNSSLGNNVDVKV